MNCNKCGKAMSDNSKFCTYCGNDLNYKDTFWSSHKLLIMVILVIILLIVISTIVIYKNSTLFSNKEKNDYVEKDFIKIKTEALIKDISISEINTSSPSNYTFKLEPDNFITVHLGDTENLSIKFDYIQEILEKKTGEIGDVFVNDITQFRFVEKILTFEEIKEIYTDIIGWIKIDGTKIDFPILQGTDNNYYMTHNYKKQYSKDGSIFLDKDCNWELPSTNLLIYGNNNQGNTGNGTMFNELLNYQEENYYKQHPIIKITMKDENSEYEIISVFLSRVYYKSETDVFRYYYFKNAETEAEFNDYIENSKSVSLYNTGKTAKFGDQLLTLSTSSYHTTDGRFVIVAKKITQ